MFSGSAAWLVAEVFAVGDHDSAGRRASGNARMQVIGTLYDVAGCDNEQPTRCLDKEACPVWHDALSCCRLPLCTPFLIVSEPNHGPSRLCVEGLLLGLLLLTTFSSSHRGGG